MPHVARGTRWSTDAADETQNAIDLTLDAVDSVTLWVEDAGIDLSKKFRLLVDSTTQATVTLAGTFGSRTVTVPAADSETTVHLHRES